ncbi:helix-turn-helix domain-containing protein [Paraliobacillus sp. JSM ZJ581]|uniref:helix-turn-helix domain-containing protein n=1 Tax=Paraliobacillus sp. JSM ZJ581 TaxID=3342118 RepID=UPI0035A8D1D1
MVMERITNRKNINEVVNETIFQFPSIQFRCLLNERCEEVGINLMELSNLTGIRYASVNELANSKKVTLNLQHILAIMVALRLKSFDELFEIYFEENKDSERYTMESDYYRNKGLPDSTFKKIEDNKIRLGR